MAKIVVAGIGPGGEDYILPVVRKMAAEADLLVGGERALAPFRGLGKETWPLTADLEGMVRRLQNRPAGQKIAVLVTGDAGFYSLLSCLLRHFPPAELDVYPGVTSVQAAFARLGLPWQDAVLLSAHGRDGNQLLERLLGPGTKAVLTDHKWTPGRLASLILNAGGRDWETALCYRLTCPGEKIVRTRLSVLDETTEGDCVMVIFHE